MLLLVAAISAVASAKNVQISMSAKWKETPLLAETCELVDKHRPGAFFACLDAVSSAMKANGTLATSLIQSQQAQHSLFDVVVPKLLPASSLMLARVELAARVYSPAVEGHRTLSVRALEEADAAPCRASPAFAVLDDGVFACSPKELRERLQKPSFTASDAPSPSISIFAGMDHVHYSSARTAVERTVVLYGVVGETTAHEFHDLLMRVPSGLRYLFRHSHVVSMEDDVRLMARWDVPLAIQGYGATLDVKNMEYKAVDEKKNSAAVNEAAASSGNAPSDDADDAVVAGFDIRRLKQRKPQLSVQLSQFAEVLASRTSTVPKRPPVQVDLQVWELQSLGYQAALSVLKAPKPLEALSDLLSNFPIRASRVSQLTASFKSLSQQLANLQRMFGDGSNAIFLNGRMVQDERADLFSLLSDIRDEQLLHDNVHNALFYDAATDLVASTMSDPQNAFRMVSRVRQCQLQLPNARRNDKVKRFYIDPATVSWINNLETDPFWEAAGSSVRELLQMNYYGQPRFPKKNIFHLVYIVDPASKEGLEAAHTILRLMEQGVAVRMGVALVDSAFRDSLDHSAEPVTPSQAAAAVLHHFISRPDDVVIGLKFLQSLLTAVSVKPLTTEFITSLAEGSTYNVPSVDALARSEEFVSNYRKVNRYVRSIGIRTFPVGLFNGLLYKDHLESVLYQAFNGEFMTIREMVIRSELTDDVENIFEFIHEKQNAIRRYQAAIFDHVTYVPFRKSSAQKILATRPAFASPAHKESDVSLLTHIMVLPSPITEEGVRAIQTMAAHLTECNDTCVGVRAVFLQCPSSRSQHHRNPIEVFLEQAQFFIQSEVKSSERATLLQIMAEALLAEVETKSVEFGSLSYENMEEILAALPNSIPVAAIRKVHIPLSAPSNAASFCADLVEADIDFPLASGPVLYMNGRKVLFDSTFLPSDFSLLEHEEAAKSQAVWVCIEYLDYVDLSNKGISSDDITADFHATKIFAVSSILQSDLATRGTRTERIYLPYLETPYSFRASEKTELQSQHTLTLVINPISREAQEYVELAKFFLANLDVSVVVFLNPPAELQKLPIKNFYQFVGSAKLTFDDEGMVRSPVAYFRHMPDDVVLTMGLVEPEAWMVFAKTADQDLDNIKLSQLPRMKHTLVAHYELQSILLTGSAWDKTTESHPKALQLVMNTRLGNQERAEGARDTLVMANYGYLQLQGNPGVWYLSVQNGIPSEIYEITSVEERDNKNVYVTPRSRRQTTVEQRSRPVVLSSFGGKHVHVQVRKQDGKEAVNFLDALSSQQEDKGGIASVWPIETGHREFKPERPTLNVFSVASGHLYERFMRMMFHTVMQTSSDINGQNTTRIKFWIIENFLSPEFKEFVPKMAARYGFDYGFVTYRWPYWLRRQTEKQRIIWAYKILFLDVLFPLDVERVIFVDSDQIVFSDLHELYNMDLQGKAVAYTPFCRGVNRNEETTGFRFWDQGYWVDHLQGKPYHISAIYLIDLKRLRRIAGGDTYRMIYDQLSADPNSLSNLDQDLPNFAQHQVPIFSLPEEWLWCETWCNQESKKRAKTVDLCNNPLTKTPKLENAKRIISNWEEMDNMLDALEKELMGK
jgi:UDP-glucose:glycoprotein glucosyltransferase